MTPKLLSKDKIGIIQAHAFGWGGAPDYCLAKLSDGRYCIEHTIEQLKMVEGISSIVIAVPACEENEIFHEIARKTDCHCLFGPYENLVFRCLAAMDLVKADIAVHVMGQHCFIDPKLLGDMVKTLDDEQACYVSMPDDFTPYFAGKVYQRGILDVVSEVAESASDLARFTAFIERQRSRFAAVVHQQVPAYSAEYLLACRKEAKNIFISGREGYDPPKASKISNPIVESYETAVRHFPENPIVLDLGCGDGFGCRIMQLHTGSGLVYGLDRDKVLIEENRKTNYSHDIIYEGGDCFEFLGKCEPFDVITAMELIEHLPPAYVDYFLAMVAGALSENGLFICSTPQNSYGRIPIIPHHEREYSLDEFKVMLERYFKIEHIYISKSGGPLIEGYEPGQKMLAICRKQWSAINTKLNIENGDCK